MWNDMRCQWVSHCDHFRGVCLVEASLKPEATCSLHGIQKKLGKDLQVPWRIVQTREDFLFGPRIGWTSVWLQKINLLRIRNVVASSCKSSSNFRSLSVVNLKIVWLRDCLSLFSNWNHFTYTSSHFSLVSRNYSGFFQCCLPSNMVILFTIKLSHLKITISSKKEPFQKLLFHLPTIDFSKIYVSFRGSTSPNWLKPPKTISFSFVDFPKLIYVFFPYLHA